MSDPPILARAIVRTKEGGKERRYVLTLDLPRGAYSQDFEELLDVLYKAADSTGMLHDGAERLEITIDRGPDE